MSIAVVARLSKIIIEHTEGSEIRTAAQDILRAYPFGEVRKQDANETNEFYFGFFMARTIIHLGLVRRVSAVNGLVGQRWLRSH